MDPDILQSLSFPAGDSLGQTCLQEQESVWNIEAVEACRRTGSITPLRKSHVFVAAHRLWHRPLLFLQADIFGGVFYVWGTSGAQCTSDVSLPQSFVSFHFRFGLHPLMYKDYLSFQHLVLWNMHLEQYRDKN